MGNVLAFAETRDDVLRNVVLETVSAARALARQLGGEAHAIVVGAQAMSAMAPRMGEYGAEAVFVTEAQGFARYNPEATASLVAERASTGGYRAVVFAASAQGRDLAPRVAAKLRVPLAADVLSIAVDAGTITVTHFAYAGKVVATLRLAAEPAVISVRPGALPAAKAAGAARVELAPPVGDPSAARVVVTETVLGDSRKLDLADAPVIVSGGRGLRAAENFQLVEALAAAFGNAAVGATRAVTDEGWRPHSDQIGQTGRQVSPDLYVALGISGAIQHLAGMKTSKTIVAINKDREAPIFKIADYGIVGDVFEVVPALTTAVQEAKKHGA
jgi:electron transfer flavoprotein alpha subunit